ncbi:hypothetical protein AMECASPLE_030494, partial [Ameca splendens]
FYERILPEDVHLGEGEEGPRTQTSCTNWKDTLICERICSTSTIIGLQRSPPSSAAAAPLCNILGFLR